MATHRKPKGVYTRSTPDWYYDQLAVVSTDAATGGGLDAIRALYNNDTAGRYIHVVGLILTANTADIAIRTGAMQGQFGNPFLSAVPVKTAQPGGPGVITAPTSNLAIAGTGLQLENLAQGIAVSLFPGFPLAVLAPGWSYIIRGGNGVAGTGFSATLYILTMPGVG